MKVLWFANTPCNAVGHLGQNTIGGGWLQALDVYLQEKVELHVAFYYNWHESSFQHGKTTYHVIPSTSIRKSNLRNIFVPHVVTDEDADMYMGIIDRVKPDLIHVHGTENPFGAILGRTNLPIVNSLQGIVAPYVHHIKCDAHEEINTWIPRSGKSLKDKILSQSLRQTYKVLDLMGKREVKAMKQYKNYIGRTDWDRRVCKALSPDCRYFVGEDILRDEFYKRHMQWKPKTGRDKVILHTTISDNPIKGFTTICETIPILEEAGLKVEWKVAGLDESSRMVRIARKMFGKAYPASSIRLLGTITASKLADELMDADIYVHPSCVENSANSIGEAMMVGMPIIATIGGGTMSVIDDKVHGLLMQIRDPWVTAGSIMELVNDQALAVQLGKNAAERAKVKHDPVRAAEQVYYAYEQILQ